MKQPRRRRDWVYRARGKTLLDPDAVDLTALEDAQKASYDPVIVTYLGGTANASARILYDSHNHFVELAGEFTGAGDPVATAFTRAGRAEGRNAVVYAVEGFVHVVPDTWAIGSRVELGWRLGVFDQEAQTGFVSVDGSYSMWNPPTGVSPFNTPAMYANDTKWVREGRLMKAFASTNTMTDFYVIPRWRSKRGRALKPTECFALYIELSSGSVAVRTQAWLRTLVSDEQ